MVKRSVGAAPYPPEVTTIVTPLSPAWINRYKLEIKRVFYLDSLDVEKIGHGPLVVEFVIKVAD